MSDNFNEFDCAIYANIGAKLYLNDETADFQFYVFDEDDCAIVPAHKLLLSTASDVFAKLFKELKDVCKTDINGTSVAAFKEFLQFFYVGRVKLTIENVAKVMDLAEKYNVTECLSLCTTFLRRFITEDNVCWAYDLAIRYKQADLQRLCELMIALNTKTVLSSIGFLECDKNVLDHVLKMDALSCSETDVFESCMNWVKRASREDNLTRDIVDAHLDELFYEIRYRSMSVENLYRLDREYRNVFAFEELGYITRLICDPDLQCEKFNKKRKKFAKIECGAEKKVCDRVVSTVSNLSPHFIKGAETTSFSTNEPMILTEIYCSGIMECQNNECEYPKEVVSSEISIVQIGDKDDVILHRSTEELESCIHTIVKLDKPIFIKPGTKYEVRFKQTIPDNYCTCQQMNSSIELESGVFVEFNGDESVPWCNGEQLVQGLLQKLIFSKI